jgi:hypothetical protein
MKNYVEPIVDLLYVEEEDILTTSDNFLAEMFAELDGGEG